MSYIGRHRKPSTTSRIQRRLALGALVAGTVTTAGLSSVSTASATQAAPDFAGMSSAATDAVTEVAQAAQITQITEALAPAPSVVRPTTGTFTSGFGPRWGTTHNGIDIANAIGTPIYAVMSGTVIDSGPASGYGQWIRIRHDFAGQKIAGMGSRGFSTGSHLHFEIHPAGMGPVDPVTWFGNHGIYF